MMAYFSDGAADFRAALGRIIGLLLLLALGLPNSAIAQPTPHTISGTVRDPAGQPLEGITLTAETRDNTALAFGFSDAAGAFSLSLSSALDSVRVRARSMSYLERTLLVRNITQRLDLTLTPGEIQLKEVTVKGAPISRQGDTLSYKVDAFATKQDRVIADVLKKMPGIEVAANSANVIIFSGYKIVI